MSDSKRTLAVVQAELVEARRDRDQHTHGGDNWRRKNGRVQLLKAEEVILSRGTKVSDPVAKSPAKKAASSTPAPKADAKASVVVVLPPYPNVDVAVALQAKSLELGKKVTLNVIFCHSNSPTQTEIKLWQAQCMAGQKPVLIGVGGQQAGLGKIPKLSSSVEGAAAFNLIIDAANGLESSSNWRARHFLPRLINEVYFLRESGDSEQSTFNRVMDVVKVTLRPQNGRQWAGIKGDSYKKDMLPLWQGFNASEADTMVPFSLPWYFRHLFCAGVDRKEIAEKVGWWISRFKACERRFREVSEKTFTVKPFSIGGRPAGFVSLGNCWEARSFQYQWLSGVLHLAICRNEKGHVVFLSSSKCRPADLTRLYQRLSADEPEKWYLHTPTRGRQILMNGGFRYDGVGRTNKGSSVLIQLAQKYVNFGK